MKSFAFKTTRIRMATLIGALVIAAALNAVLGILSASIYQQQIAELQEYTAILDQHSFARVSLLKQQLAVKNAFLSQEVRAQDYGNIGRYSQQFNAYLYDRQLQYGSGEQIAELTKNNEDLNTQIDLFLNRLSKGKSSANELAWINLEKIDPYTEEIDHQIQTLSNQDAQSMLKLLDSMKEIGRISMVAGQAALLLLGVTLVPLRLYVKGRTAKLEIGLGKGKKMYNKKETIKRREEEREVERTFKTR